MHILLLASYAPSLVNFRGPLIRDLRDAGCKVSVGAPNFSAEDRLALGSLEADVYETPLQRTGQNPSADLFYYRQLRRLIATIRPDRILTYTIKPNIWGSFAAAAESVNSYAMVTGLGVLFTDDVSTAGTKPRLLRKLATTLYARSTSKNRRVIFQNPDDLEDFFAAGCLNDRTKAALVNGSGVDMRHYSRSPLLESASFLMISRLLRSKGVREYAEAAIALKEHYPQSRFRLVGYFDEGADSISRVDLERWVNAGLEYSGPLADIRPAMAEASVYVLPSYREGTPRSVLEAMAMGRPVITTDVPGCRETVKNDSNGFLVSVRSASAVRDAMLRFIKQPSLISTMGDTSFRIAKEKYEVGAVNRSLMELLDLDVVLPVQSESHV